ncbi:MAG: helix-turn-helix domain-containing protein [Candidatus Cloacimonetes bacterium]|nr:helix-turn-helix domain-containing protein [Candidatus Cloacimonadota bacterium]
MEQTQELNRAYLKKRALSLGLKQWQIAESIRVEPKTISRWFSGKVKKVKMSNLFRLSETLNCGIDDLSLVSTSDETLTNELQNQCASLICDTSVITLLTPSGNWKLADSLIQLSLATDVSLENQANLLNQLSIVSWRQDKLDLAQSYAKKAMDLGVQLKSKTILSGAFHNLATIYSFLGLLNESKSYYQKVIEIDIELNNRNGLAISYSCLGCVFHQIRDFSQADHFFDLSDKLFSTLNNDLDYSILLCSKGLLYIESQAYTQAKESFEKALILSKQSGYQRGIRANTIYLQRVLYFLDPKWFSVDVLLKSIEWMEEQSLFESLNYYFLCDIYLDQGDLKSAKQALDKAMQYAEGYPCELIDCYYREIKYFSLRDNEKAKSRVKKKLQSSLKVVQADCRLKLL